MLSFPPSLQPSLEEAVSFRAYEELIQPRRRQNAFHPSECLNSLVAPKVADN